MEVNGIEAKCAYIYIYIHTHTTQHAVLGEEREKAQFRLPSWITLTCIKRDDFIECKRQRRRVRCKNEGQVFVLFFRKKALKFEEKQNENRLKRE